jgi:hypothetical protein
VEDVMRISRVPLIAVLAAALVFSVAVSLAGQTKPKEGTTVKSAHEEKKAILLAPEKSEYLVVSPHDSESCLKALDGVAALGDDVLKKYDWGCMAGDHTGYIMVKAENEEEALKVVPESLRSQARAVKLNKFTRKQIESFHKPDTRSE